MTVTTQAISLPSGEICASLTRRNVAKSSDCTRRGMTLPAPFATIRRPYELSTVGAGTRTLWSPFEPLFAQHQLPELP